MLRPPCSDLDSAADSTTPDPTIPLDAPSIEEVVAAIRKLKNARAPGPDGIQPELLKYAETPVSSALHALFIQVWKSGRVPAEWREGIIVSLYKGKGERATCGSYRPITLLSVPGKVFAHVLLARLQPLFNSVRRPQQCSFTAGRSTIDAILALRLLSELHHEFNRPLHVAYIDIKAAFDSVDRLALWKALRASGTPPFLVQLLEDLHRGIKSRVRADGQLSEPFDTTSGVRQGCVLAPALFCITMNWILNRCTESMGVTVASTRFTDQAYADDGVVLFKWPEILTTFDAAAETMGLHSTYIMTENEDSEYWPRYTAIFCLHAGQWTNSRSSRSVSISWQYYQFRWTISAGNTSSD